LYFDQVHILAWVQFQGFMFTGTVYLLIGIKLIQSYCLDVSLAVTLFLTNALIIEQALIDESAAMEHL